MQIPADPESAFWSPIAKRCTVFLDGVEQRNCVVADEEGGNIYRYLIGEDGRELVDYAGDLLGEAVWGDVAIVYPGMNFDA